jgi:hypothetical protein
MPLTITTKSPTKTAEPKLNPRVPAILAFSCRTNIKHELKFHGTMSRTGLRFKPCRTMSRVASMVASPIRSPSVIGSESRAVPSLLFAFGPRSTEGTDAGNLVPAFLQGETMLVTACSITPVKRPLLYSKSTTKRMAVAINAAAKAFICGLPLESVAVILVRTFRCKCSQLLTRSLRHSSESHR